MELSPDQITIVELGPVTLNATLVFTWLVMGILAGGSWLITRNLSTGTEISRWQNLLEAIVTTIRDQIRAITGQDPSDYLPFIGTLFLFISLANLLSVVPGYEPPTGSLSTTAALTACVFVAVPLYGVAKRGFFGYLKNYIEPTPFMLPFNLVSEISRTVALAIRLFGNIMSGRILVGIMLSIIPLLLPTVLQVLELIVGQIQAYIFATLATVYIASGTSETAA
ncbi:MAG: F0F1 ATP synthase subunit A [Chloroflexi bacterium]|nr:F0F1 ATP synthase subunit A [Chloroflexota bacterium]